MYQLAVADMAQKYVGNVSRTWSKVYQHLFISIVYLIQMGDGRHDLVQHFIE